MLGKKIYCIPRNQRKYVWGNDNWKNLLEDLDFLQGTGKYHFLGSIVLNTQSNPNNDDIEYYEIVDGQQRITAIILILIVIAQIFKDRNEDALFQGLLPYIQTTNINNQTSSTLHTDVHTCIVVFLALCLRMCINVDTERLVAQHLVGGLITVAGIIVEKVGQHLAALDFPCIKVHGLTDITHSYS